MNKKEEFRFILSKIFGLISFIGFCTIFLSAVTGYQSWNPFYVTEVSMYEQRNPDMGVVWYSLFNWLVVVWILPYWVSYFLNPSPDKRFLFKSWKI